MPLDSRFEILPEATAVLTLTGHITLGSSLAMLNAQLDRTIADSVSFLAIDLTGVDFCDSAGLGMLVNTHGLLKKKGGSLRLCAVHPHVLELLRMTNMDTVIAIDADRAASLAALGR